VLTRGNQRRLRRTSQIQSAGVNFEDLNGPLTAALETGAKPTVAAITGAALGGGLEVAMACNARVCELAAMGALSAPSVRHCDRVGVPPRPAHFL